MTQECALDTEGFCDSIVLIINCLSLLFCEARGMVCCSVTQSCPTLCNPMGCSTPAFPVLHYHREFAQTRVHWVDDAIQPYRPLLSPSPPAFNFFQHQGLFQWLGSLHQVAKVWELPWVLPVNIQDWFPLGLTALIFLLSKELSRGISSTMVRRHQFFGAQPFSLSNPHSCTWLVEKP